jgi:hypothetical protein
MLTIDFSFRELEVFCKVVELGSFSRASEAVFLVQASVSERIATLEKRSGSGCWIAWVEKRFLPLPENFYTKKGTLCPW